MLQSSNAAVSMLQTKNIVRSSNGDAQVANESEGEDAAKANTSSRDLITPNNSTSIDAPESTASSTPQDQMHPGKSQSASASTDQQRVSLEASKHELSILEHQFVLSVTEKGTLDNGLKNWHSAMASASAASAFYTSTPLATALCKRNVQAGAILIGCAFLAMAALLSDAYFHTVSHTHNMYRFTTLEYRNGSAATAPNVAYFAVMLDACSGVGYVKGEEVSGASMTITYTEHVPMNGLYFMTYAGRFLCECPIW